MNDNGIYKIYQIIEFFVNKNNYSTLYTNKYNNQNEVWLFNSKNKNYQLIRITSLPINDTNIDIERINSIIEDFEKLNGIKDAVVLDVHVCQDKVNNDEIFETICIDLNYYDGINLESIYPGITKVIHPIDNLENEIKRAISSINTTLTAKQRLNTFKNIKNQLLSSSNAITLTISILCVITYLITSYLSSKYDNSSVLVFLGADYKIFTLGLMELWRLVTSAFLHGSLIHLICNLISFMFIGSMVERLLGKVKYIVMLLTGILVGSLTHGVLNTNSLTVGLSGGIYCLFVYFVIYFIADKRLTIQQLFPTIAFNIYLNFLSSVAWQAHLGGALCGLLFYYIYKDNKIDIKLSITLLVLIGGLFYKYYDDYAIKPYFGATDMEVVKIYQDLGLNKHASRIEKELYKIYVSE